MSDSELKQHVRNTHGGLNPNSSNTMINTNQQHHSQQKQQQEESGHPQTITVDIFMFKFTSKTQSEKKTYEEDMRPKSRGDTMVRERILFRGLRNRGGAAQTLCELHLETE
ncbi:unnamed protein product [Ceratitis capitata]|uniref:(Mediterranean fruit fly) hypothetical protein n=1 Tax=Ceratitis capitata TaxID=7213 RepID=A0A811UXY1_CERCA|nr:unnamed protein product [Ceratitis capitata]